MSDLSRFPHVPAEGHVTVREENGELIAEPDNVTVSHMNAAEYPDIDLSLDLLKPSVSKESARSAFLEHDTQAKRLWHAWYEHGLTGVLEELANSTQCKDKEWLSKTACTVLGAVRWFSSLHGTLFPHYSMSNDEITSEFSQNPNWLHGYARCFAWHPHTAKFAVCLHDDVVKIHTLSRPDFVPTLKHKLQKGVSALAWRPNSASLLAIACHNCVIVWNIEPTSLASRPSTSAAHTLHYTGHSPVTDVAWDPTGNLLLSVSATCTAMLVWDGVSKAPCVPLRRFGGGGMSLLAYSPDSSKVLSATPSNMFRLWETHTWTCETWTKLSSRIQSAVWSYDGSILLFSCADECSIYCVHFSKASGEKQTSDLTLTDRAVICADLKMELVENENGEMVSVGGPIQSLAWDHTSERLVVQFGGIAAAYIAVFETRLKPVLELVPCGFIRGHAGEIPNIISFQPKVKTGALLTVIWSSGRLSHIPMYFIPAMNIETSNISRVAVGNGQAFNKFLFTSDNE